MRNFFLTSIVYKMIVHFTKMHGCWNDMIIVDNLDKTYDALHTHQEARAQLCRRSFWIGSDGLIFIQKNASWMRKYVMYNSDGTHSEMCWNGIRCFYKLLKHKAYIPWWSIDVETDAGILTLQEVEWWDVLVDMWKPIIWESWRVNTEGHSLRYQSVSTWNPHCVLLDYIDWFVSKKSVLEIWPKIENLIKLFPMRTNVTFPTKANDGINLHVRERGCWYTLACGTATTWTIAGLIVQKLIEPWTHLVHLPGGNLTISWTWNVDDHIWMSWPAEIVFEWTVEVLME